MTAYPYGFREQPMCNCGQLFNTTQALNSHITELIDDVQQWPNGNRGHGNFTQKIAITEREHEQEQLELERLQDQRLRSTPGVRGRKPS
ncbi:MAG TPA: hypothetical protein VGJ60_07415 [Chloroflexota bacterium]|jgi:hypothetical protein